MERSKATVPRKRKKYNRWSRRIERNLLTCYQRANEHDRAEGLTWYQQAHDTASGMGARYGITIEQACGVIAALSPGRNWGGNILDADALISARVSGQRAPMVGTYGRRNVVKATAILSGKQPLDVLGGFKVRAFYANILNPRAGEPVTVDRHAKCAAYSKRSADNSLVTNAEYRYIAWHFRRLAERLGLIPNQFQAVCWVTWRRLAGALEQQDIPF